jgi:type IV pilus biogenesis protein PilP
MHLNNWIVAFALLAAAPVAVAASGNTTANSSQKKSNPYTAKPRSIGKAQAALVGNDDSATDEAAAMAPADTPTAHKLDQLRAQEALLTERLKVEELRAKLAKARKSAKGQDDDGDGGKNQKQSGKDSRREDAHRSLTLPSFRSIVGFGKKLAATLVFADGSTLKVHSGDRLPDGLRIKSIDVDSVRVATRLGVRQLPKARSDSDNHEAGPQMLPGAPLQAAPMPAAPMPKSTDSTDTKPH